MDEQYNQRYDDTAHNTSDEQQRRQAAEQTTDDKSKLDDAQPQDANKQETPNTPLKGDSVPPDDESA